jgi:hypothetical protein
LLRVIGHLRTEFYFNPFAAQKKKEILLCITDRECKFYNERDDSENIQVNPVGCAVRRMHSPPKKEMWTRVLHVGVHVQEIMSSPLDGFPVD